MPILHPEFRLFGSSRSHIIAKLLLITVIGVVTGVAIVYSNRAGVAQGNALTLEQYTAGYEAYKAHLIGQGTNMPLFIIVGIMMSAAFFLPYEVIGALLSHLFDRAAPPARRPLDGGDTT